MFLFVKRAKVDKKGIATCETHCCPSLTYKLLIVNWPLHFQVTVLLLQGYFLKYMQLFQKIHVLDL